MTITQNLLIAGDKFTLKQRVKIPVTGHCSIFCKFPPTSPKTVLLAII